MIVLGSCMGCTMTPLLMQNEGFRLRFRERLNQFRHRSRNPLDYGSIHSPKSIQLSVISYYLGCVNQVTSTNSISQDAVSTGSSLTPNQADDAPVKSTDTSNDEA